MPAPSSIPYIDNHTHPDQSDMAAAAEAAVQAMTRENMKQVVFMPPPFLLDNPERYDAELIIPAAKKYPGKIKFYGGGGSLNGMLHKAARTGNSGPEIQQEFKKRAEELAALGVSGFGELSLERFSPPNVSDYHSAPPDHPLMLILADVAAQHGIPIDVHMEAVPQTMPLPAGLKSPPHPTQLSPNIAAFEKLLNHNSKANIIWAHGGADYTGQRTPDLTRQLLQRHPNLYVEIKIDPPRPGLNSPLADGASGTVKPEWQKLFQDFPDRFVIGSDQHYGPKDELFSGNPRWAAAVAMLNQLPEAAKRKVASENVERLESKAGSNKTSTK